MRSNGTVRHGGRPASTRSRGSALITVILVALVLTVVGLGIAFFATTEDKASGNVRMSKIGFYAAEAGLRAGEAAVTSFAVANNADVSALLADPGAAKTYTPPGAGRPAYLLELAGQDFEEVLLPAQLGDPNQRAMYTVYIRNNEEDLAGGDNADTDRRVNIVVVGQVVLVDSLGNVVKRGGRPTVGITKVLEEQIQTTVEGAATATQKGANVGGTSAGAK